MVDIVFISIEAASAALFFHGAYLAIDQSPPLRDGDAEGMEEMLDDEQLVRWHLHGDI